MVKDAFATNWIAPLGPQVDKFEAEFAELVGNAKLLDKSYSLLGEDAKRPLSGEGSLLSGGGQARVIRWGLWDIWEAHR